MTKWLACLMLVSACGGSQSYRVYRLPSACEDAVDDAEAQHCAGWLLDELMTVKLGVYEDEELLEYVRSIGLRIASETNRDDISWTFRILDEPGVQAWAGPDGHVYVTRGLLARLGSEAELAAVLAHEIGHIVAGHTDVLLDNLPEPSFAGEDWNHSFRLSQDDEAQADQLAVAYVRGAGYEAAAVQTMLRAVYRTDDESGDNWFERHPPLPVRLALTARVAAGSEGGLVRRPQYLEQIEGIVVGHDPRRGRINELRYVHQSGGFSFQVPDGWTHEEWRPGYILTQWFNAWSPDEHSAVAVLPLSTPYGDTLAAAFEQDLSRRPTTSTQLAGYEAVQGTFTYGEENEMHFTGGTGMVHAAMFEGRDGQTYGLLVRSAEESGRPVQELYQSIARTFRPDEGDRQLPLRMRLMRAPRSMTLGQLAAAGCAAEGETQTIDNLNELELDATIEAGGIVKCLGR